MASGNFDLLAAQRASGHDQRATESNAQAARVTALRPQRPSAELLLAFADQLVQDAGIRLDHHRSVTVPSSERDSMRSINLERNEVYDVVRTDVKPFVRGISNRGAAARYHEPVITLGIDPGTAICGFGVVALDGGRLRLVDAGCIRTSSEETDATRLQQLHVALRALVREHRPARVGVERLFFQRNVQTAMAVGQARGIALLVAAEAGLDVDEPTPNEVKQAVCGNGSAAKDQVAAMVQRLLGASLAGVADDATDALAIAIGTAYRAAAEPKAVIG